MALFCCKAAYLGVIVVDQAIILEVPEVAVVEVVFGLLSCCSAVKLLCCCVAVLLCCCVVFFPTQLTKQKQKKNEKKRKKMTVKVSQCP